ncbi:class I SAM-dependent methyltransferase [Candidatus Desantisbacteria bacterium]|nr:class I SAM-dependent methyltransferase [Candidatus Desantisbacteria bacterium]
METMGKYSYSEKHHWWHRARRHIIFTLLSKYVSRGRQDILDVGCGPGETMGYLERFGRVMGVDVSYDAVRFCKNKGHKHILCASAENLPIRDESFSLITMLDVLEHIDDDAKTLQELVRIVKPNGIIILTTPAYRFLWSDIDEICKHKRRYTTSELRNKLKAAGLYIERMSYMNALLLPVTWMSRRLRAITVRDGSLQSPFDKNYPAWVAFILESLFKLEAMFLRLWNLPFGVSIICVAKKL